LKIPIQNIYYLLCYAWNKLEESNRVFISSSDYKEAIDLFARVLVNGCNHLFKKGLDRNYLEFSEEYPGIKGKIEFNKSLNKNLFKKGRAICLIDELEYNILPNQLIKATLKRVTKINSIDKRINKEVWKCYFKMTGIDDIEISIPQFSRVRIHRNNSNYDFLLRICKLIIENTVLDERSGKYHFKDFTGNDKAMAFLYESFIRNFYKKEQSEFTVRREDIQWNAIAVDESISSYLPKMQTDISLEASSRKIIIEAKYYQNTLSTNYESEKINSSNLYQLYSYLRNIEAKENHPQNANCEGIILYPTVEFNLNETYLIGGHRISIKTIDLSRNWRDIYHGLLDIIKN
jgi:5-methylcytosine-specific restriction enzyme subunit McrC